MYIYELNQYSSSCLTLHDLFSVALILYSSKLLNLQDSLDRYQSNRAQCFRFQVVLIDVGPKTAFLLS